MPIVSLKPTHKLSNLSIFSLSPKTKNKLVTKKVYKSWKKLLKKLSKQGTGDSKHLILLKKKGMRVKKIEIKSYVLRANLNLITTNDNRNKKNQRLKSLNLKLDTPYKLKDHYHQKWKHNIWVRPRMKILMRLEKKC